MIWIFDVFRTLADLCGAIGADSGSPRASARAPGWPNRGENLPPSATDAGKFLFDFNPKIFGLTRIDLAHDLLLFGTINPGQPENFRVHPFHVNLLLGQVLLLLLFIFGFTPRLAF